MLGYCMSYTVITSVSRRNQIHHQDASRFSEVDPHSHKKNKHNVHRPVRLSECECDVVSRAGIEHQVANELSSLAASGEVIKLLKDEFLLLLIDTMHKLRETRVFVIDTTKNHVIPLKSNSTEVSLDSLLAENVFLIEQTQYIYYRTANVRTGCQGFEFYLDNHWPLICKPNVDKTTEIVAPKSLWKWILYPLFHLKFSGHRGRRSMYNKLRRRWIVHLLFHAAFSGHPGRRSMYDKLRQT